MGLIIKLTRSGQKRNPFYAIVAVKKNNKGSAKLSKKLGYFTPIGSNQFGLLFIKRKFLAKSISEGAVISSKKLKSLLLRTGFK